MIIGDAAHPSSSCTSFPASDAHVPTVLPHMAGGAMSAIEDAESLAAVLQFEPKSNINSALNRAFRIRFKRASFFQLSSRVGGIKRRAPLSHEENVKNWNYLGAIEWEARESKMVLRVGEDAVYELED
jgi:2-polyprenyl-6-methoxyphenol hydroxylase-like FAD-dependent oxidoreductase